MNPSFCIKIQRVYEKKLLWIDDKPFLKAKPPGNDKFTGVYQIIINKGQVSVSDSLSSPDFFSAKMFSEKTFTDACSAAFCSAFFME